MIKQQKVRKMFLLALLFMLVGNIFSAETGDALQLLSYRVTDSTKPNVMDGLVAPVTNPTDWSAAYVRNMIFDINGTTPDVPSAGNIFIANDMDTLYISLVSELTNAADGNLATIYFDQGTPNVLDGDATNPGEYYISLFANGNAAEDGYWNGTSWVANTITSAIGCGERRGAGGTQTYNYEFKIPLSKLGDASNNYLNIQAGDEVRVLFKITMATGGNDEYFWTQTNALIDDPASTGTNGATGWAEIKTIGEGIADRNFVSLNAKGILPTIDGNVSTDTNWKYSFSKNVVFTDYNGNKLDGTIKIKEESGPERFIFGVIIENYTPIAADYLALYQDQGSTGNNRDFVLSQGGDPVFDNALRMMGDGTFVDFNFDSNNWIADGVVNGTGAIDVSGTDWEIEIEMPFNSGNADDLAIASDDILGALFNFHDSANNRDYWLSSTINTELVEIDPVDPVYNALGWAVLQTGGPFVQSIYPESGDTIGGEYPLAVYTVDPTDAVPELGINNVTYEVRLEDTAAGTYTVLKSGIMSKVEDDNIPIWTATLDTRTIIQPLNTLMKLVYIVEDGEIDPVSVPLDIYINNDGGTGQLSDPVCELTSPLPHVELSGSGNSLNFTVSTDSMLTIDSVMVFVDGEMMSAYSPVGVYTYSETYLWDTSNLPDGEHIIQIWGKNSLNITNYSPSTLVYTKNSPSISITSPAPSVIVNGVINFDFTANPISPALLTTTEISIDGGTWTAVTTQPAAAGGIGSHTFDTTDLNDGTHGFVIRTTDDSGRIGLSQELQIITDNLPNVSITSPASSIIVNGVISFDFTANPISPALLTTTEISIDGGTWIVATTQPIATGGNGSHSFDTTNLDDGTHEIVIRTTDNLNRVGYSSDLNIIVDNTAPMGIVTIDKYYVKNGDTILFEYHGNEPDLTVTLPLVQLQLLDGNATVGLTLTDPDMNGVYSSSYTISANNLVADGTVTLTFSVTDQIGNQFTPSVSVILDNTLPVLTPSIYPIPVIDKVYVRDILFDCSYFDSNIESIVLRHTNSAGNDINNSPLSIQLSDDNAFSRSLAMIDSTNNINITLTDKSGNILSYDTRLFYVDPRITNIIGENGGTVTSPDGTIVNIPADALLSDEEITIMTISTEGLPQPYNGISLLKNAHEFGPEDLIFHEPVEISLSYNDFDLDLNQDGASDINENDLEVFTLDGNTWIKTVADNNDVANNLVTFTTNHFSVYALGTQIATDAIKVYWTKNPFSANNSTTVVAELDDSGIVSLKIYDMSGDLVRVLADQMPVSGTTNIKWDGKNDYDNYVGSGIYIYVFEFENSTTGVKETIKKPIGVIK
ncbi:MAG: hypothetical protein PF638_07145 [Candidatus Delongbacteria bacterium]|jgi:hypothetical protein|nr:hypothetical protein [Candidatus Delongbacteria bacterium]